MNDKEAIAALLRIINGLIPPINAVTCPHRHGGKPSRKWLDNLANRQIDAEDDLANVLEAIGHTTPRDGGETGGET